VKRVPRSFFARDSRIVAPELLNKLLVRGDRVGRIVEVEAYAGREDPASHGFRGPTARNEVMFGPAGHLYVYFTYGMHFCANAVCGTVGESSAVLLRALAPVGGLDEMRAARGPAARRDRDLCSGPAKLCQAFGIDRDQDGGDLVGGEDVSLFDDGTRPPTVAGVSRRVGISVAVDEPWRWFVAGDPNVSVKPR
jgi:DNA-3-methyladenine glycosylase